MSKISLRKAEFADLQVIIDILQDISVFRPNDAPQELWKKFMRSSNTVALVAEVGGDLVGYGVLLIETKIRGGNAGHIEDIVTKDTHRGSGVGRQIINGLIREARDRGCYKLSLQCRKENEGFYDFLGFEKSGTAMQFFFD